MLDPEFVGIGNLEEMNGPEHNNLCIGQYGSSTLRPCADIQKRTGSTDGFFFDWLVKDFETCGGDRPPSGTNDEEASEKNNANREYLDVRFPCLYELKDIRF